MGGFCSKAGERETRQKSVSLPPKVGELASLSCDLPNTRFGVTVYNMLHLQAHVSSAIPLGGPQARDGTL